MTYGDIFLQALLEAAPERKDEFLKTFEFIKNLPEHMEFNKEVPEHEAESLLKALRQDKDGILAMIMRGNLGKPPFDA
ncbi:MAG TPA: hypothetical protein VI728_00325 [Syntrophales bacterium]|nr:hypothetical protein [Syntrophales bacterium]